MPQPPDPFRGPTWDDELAGEVVEPGTAPTRQRRRRTSRRRLARRRRYGRASLVVGGLILLAGLYVLVTALLARRQLESVRAEVRELRVQISAGDLDGARSTARQISDHAGSAHGYTAGPVWALAAKLPAGGAPFDTVRTITAQVDVLGRQVLPQVVTATRSLDPSTLRKADGAVDVARIQAVAPDLATADRSLRRATARIGAQPASTWLSSVDSARTDLLTQMRSLGKTLHSADLAARVAPQMLGVDGVRRYFVGFQNNAEARGTGGIPGAFAIVKADHGRLTFERFEPDGTLGAVKTGLDLGPEYTRLYGSARPANLYVNSNISPNFPDAARIWIAMWQKYSGERLDGALAVDPQALSYLLAVTGPVRTSTGVEVSANSIVDLTERKVYAQFPVAGQQDQRKKFLLAIARSASTHILDSRASYTGLLRAAGRGGSERRILVYSADPSLEAGLGQTTFAGVIPDTASAYSGLSVVNEGGNKLDYYLDRSVTWQRSGCGPTRDVTVTITLTNGAPKGLPAYASSRSDTHRYKTQLGDNKVDVYYYATRGAGFTSITVNGRPSTAGSYVSQGHSVFTISPELPRGTTTTIVLHLREPGVGATPIIMRQPLVRPLSVTVRNQKCG